MQTKTETCVKGGQYDRQGMKMAEIQPKNSCHYRVENKIWELKQQSKECL